MTYDPGSSGALSYLEAAKELALQGLDDAGDTGRNSEGADRE
jgi:chromosome partitioning protein